MISRNNVQHNLLSSCLRLWPASERNTQVNHSLSDIISKLQFPGIIAIVRARQLNHVSPMFKALLEGGINAIEITMTTPNALEVIRQAGTEFGNYCLVGVGTVLDVATCSAAIDAGAQFVVTPICRTELVSIAHAAGKPIMLGAYTPTEAQLAYEAGADFIKIFPADNLGATYIKALRAPLPHLRIVPTGGVDCNNVNDFFKAGCVAVGAGSSLISLEILEKADWPELTRRAGMFVTAAQSVKKK
jgi:2-dehydro-3-deoxyphosphogluconate aldolase/(4S)-4-hydroxy-2-oxoglutarate aldolase